MLTKEKIRRELIGQAVSLSGALAFLIIALQMSVGGAAGGIITGNIFAGDNWYCRYIGGNPVVRILDCILAAVFVASVIFALASKTEKNDELGKYIWKIPKAGLYTVLAIVGASQILALMTQGIFFIIIGPYLTALAGYLYNNLYRLGCNIRYGLGEIDTEGIKDLTDEKKLAHEILKIHPEARKHMKDDILTEEDS